MRRFDHGSIEAGALERPSRSKLFEVACTEDVRLKWWGSRHYASRVAGRILSRAEAAEMIAAEALSAMPVDEPLEQDRADADPEDPCDAAGAAELADLARVGPPPRFDGYGTLQVLLDGLHDADAFELDARLRRALCLEQRLDARMGPLLFHVWGRWLHRALGYRTREAYARERLGMDPTRARALVRLERAAMQSEPFARAYRPGELSWVKAGIVAPLVRVDPLGRFMEDWIAWAKQVTVRRSGRTWTGRSPSRTRIRPHSGRRAACLRTGKSVQNTKSRKKTPPPRRRGSSVPGTGPRRPARPPRSCPRTSSRSCEPSSAPSAGAWRRSTGGR